MVLFGVLNKAKSTLQDRLLIRAVERIVNALALTEYDNAETATALESVLFSEDEAEKIIEFRELRSIINQAGNKWSTEGMVQIAQNSVECPDFIKDALVKIAERKNIEIVAVTPGQSGENITHITDLQSRLGTLSTARDELETTVALRTSLLTWQDIMQGKTIQ